MKVYFPNNSRFNKAMMLLATMSPDMVDDIVQLCTNHGRSVVSMATDENSGPKPLAVLSRAFITDEDFPLTWLGISTVMLANFRTLNHDNDFYEKTLRDAFSMPAPMAAAYAKQIETIDSIGGSKEAAASRAWWTKLYQGAAEYIRRGVNGIGQSVNWENDQTQDFDLDYLYECMRLGQAVDTLQSRARLIRGQAGINAVFGLFNSPQGNIYKGLLGGGDVAEVDPVTSAEIEYYDTARPLTSSKLPQVAYGGLGGFVGKALEFAGNGIKSYIRKAAGTNGQNADVAKAAALTRIEQGPDGPSSLAHATRAGVPVSDLIQFILQYTQNSGGQGESTGDIEGYIADTYGDTVAGHLSSGNFDGAIQAMIEADKEPWPSTGDPDLDQQILEANMGDIDSEVDHPEIGGLLKRLKAKAKIRKAVRKRGKRKKFEAKMKSKMAEQDNLSQAEDAVTQENRTMQNVQNYFANPNVAAADDFNTHNDQQLYPVVQHPDGQIDILSGVDFSGGGGTGAATAIPMT